jgi:hypothetical protein
MDWELHLDPKTDRCVMRSNDCPPLIGQYEWAPGTAHHVLRLRLSEPVRGSIAATTPVPEMGIIGTVGRTV